MSLLIKDLVNLEFDFKCEFNNYLPVQAYSSPELDAYNQKLKNYLIQSYEFGFLGWYADQKKLRELLYG